MNTRPAIPGGEMTVRKAKKRWEDLRKTVMASGDNDAIEAMMKFQGIAETAFFYWEQSSKPEQHEVME